jgi:hypothetical protein
MGSTPETSSRDDRAGGLVAWQYALYPDNHTDRRNLVIHVMTVPLFHVGTVALLASPFVGWWPLPGALFSMIAAVVMQGRGHRLEKVAPVPFRGPLDVVARIFVEQWVTWPRFMLGGGFASAWKRAGSG